MMNKHYKQIINKHMEPVFPGVFFFPRRFAALFLFGPPEFGQVVQWCQAHGVVVVPGVATPSEAGRRDPSHGTTRALLLS